MIDFNTRVGDLPQDMTIADVFRQYLWIDAKETLPEKSGFYDVCFWNECTNSYIFITNVAYSKQHNLWNCFDGTYEPEVLVEKRRHPFQVDYWMPMRIPMPEPPEEES